MQSNYIGNAILGTIFNGQGIVAGTHRGALRVLMFKRRLSLRLRDWRSLWRTPAGMTPAMATCPSYPGSCLQHKSWMPGVVVTGTVGVL